MKRIVTLLLAAGLVFGAFGGAQAADIKAKGQWDFNFEFLNNTDFQSKEHGGQGGDTFAGKQRLRTQIDIVASESLSGTVYFEMGETIWGKEDGALGADGKSVKVKRSYIDWIVPNTDLKVRMGIQGLALPGFVAGSPVLDDDVAAVTMSYAFNDMVAATAFWARPYDTGGDQDSFDTNTGKNAFDEMDLFGLIVPVTLDGMKIQPWAMYSSIGKDVNGGAANYNQTSWGQAAGGMLPVGKVSFDKDTTAWWGGLSYELSMFDPIRFKMDGIYGSVQADDEAWERSGWLVIGSLDYKMSMMTPGLFAWYGSGDDDDANNGSERMPYIMPDFGPTSFGFDKPGAPIATDSLLSVSGAGTWGVGLQLADISFIENLKHTLRVAYIKGTNDAEMAKTGGADLVLKNGYGTAKAYNGLYLTDEDSAWEVNFDHTYNIYENLALIVEMGYIKLDVDEDTWGNNEYDDAMKLGFNLKYSF
ncbi:outer membrane homotrimeric porin [Nitratidesulfovibrio vulgaris]|uniref:outer membrane homotrimeric porin n=1 Tax=Nitratidesulfovibrio vulgaris TaxID=881 RepID=UPI0023002DD1|nr:outer membrane homotrimeric porin [Nitratidesulfovibrio vulgaris]WCB47455.1 outer membrane homotrimeric porin [Nitratidesulfovibrio vulgaris]